MCELIVKKGEQRVKLKTADVNPAVESKSTIYIGTIT